MRFLLATLLRIENDQYKSLQMEHTKSYGLIGNKRWRASAGTLALLSRI
jgi:hypothetical protein